MEKIKSLNSIQYLWAYSVCFYVIIMANVSWGWGFPRRLLMAYIAIISLLKLETVSSWIPKKTAVHIGSIALYALLTIFIWNNGELERIFNSSVFLILMTSILLARNEEKRFLLTSMTNCFVVMLLISIPAWILFLIGVPLPHSGEFQPDDFHLVINYKFFLLSVRTLQIFPRFQSIFLEPGQFATPCAFLYFLNGANFSRKNILFLIAILLSFSLIAYGLIILAFISSRMFNSKKNRVLKTVLSVVVVAGISFYFSSSENGDDPITALIVNRLQYDEDKGLTGNNRTGSYFESQYAKVLSSDDRYWGIHQQLEKGEDWTYNASGYKKVIVHRGIIGLAVILLVLILLFWFNRNLATLSFFVIVLLAYLVRDLLMSPLWLSIVIIGFYLLYETDKEKTDKQTEKVKTFKYV